MMTFRQTEAHIGRRYDAYTGMAWERLEAQRAEETERAEECPCCGAEWPEPHDEDCAPYCPEGCRTSLPPTELQTCPGCGAGMVYP